jgi:hypothetical protein
VLVELENAGIDRAVEVRVGTREGAQYATRIDLPNGARKSVTLYVYVTPASRRLFARLLSEGQELATQPITLQPANPAARIVGVVTAEGTEVRAPARLNSATPLTLIPLAPAALPERGLGLSGFGALLLEDVATADLSAAQLQAIREWVMRGGQLILSGGPGVERTLAGLPAELVPASISPAAPAPAETIFDPAAAGLAPVPYATLAPRSVAEGPSPYALPLPALGSGAQRLPAVEQSVGRGTVTMVAFPLSHPAMAGWEAAADFWAELLRAGSELPPGFAPENITADGFVEGNLAASLTSLPALQFPPLGLLAAVVGAYIVLVGPVTYLVLRRLDRQALGWVVVPTITVVFGLLTYGLGLAQRGGDVVLNQVTLIEPVDGTAQARVRSFVGIFSPERRSYTLAAGGPGGEAALLRPISIQGPWDVSGGSVGGVYLQEGSSGAATDGFEIAQWSMRALTADVIIPGVAAEARIVVDGDKLLGEVTNRGNVPLLGATLLQGNAVARFGDVPPGETRRGELQQRPGAAAMGMGMGGTAPVSYLVFKEEIDQQSRSGGQPLPPDLQQRIRLLDALYNYGPSTRAGQPLLIAWADTKALDLLPADVRADEQHSAIVAGSPRIEAADGRVDLKAGWLAPRFEGGQFNACFGGQGTGVTLGPEPVTMRLVLPRDLYHLRLNEMTLLTGSDSPWSDATTVELFDWTTGGWDNQAVRGRQQVVPDPARFLSSSGVIRVRVGSEGVAMNMGCVYIDATLKGELS